MNKETPPTTFQTWLKSFEIITAKRDAFLKISMYLIFLPSLAFSLLLHSQSLGVVEEILSLKEMSYIAFLDPAYHFFVSYLLCGFIFFCFISVGFLSCIHIGVSFYQDEELSAVQAIKMGFKQTFPHGLLILFFSCILSLERLFFGPLRVFSVFSLMAGVIFVVERKSSLRSLKKALLFKYNSPVHGSSFSTAFVLIGLSALLFAVEFTLDYAGRFILHGDELLEVSRDFWVQNISLIDMPAVLLFEKVVQSLGVSFMLVVCTSFLVALFYTVQSRFKMKA